MRTIKTIGGFLLLFILPSITNALDIPEDLAKWYQTRPPTNQYLPSSAPTPHRLTDPGVMRYLANLSQYKWMVYKLNGRVTVKRFSKNAGKTELPFKIRNHRRYAGQQVALPVEDGWLIGFNAGEWGGSFWWFSKDGKRRYKISDDQIIQFLRVGKEIYAFEGLAHLGHSRGRMIQLSRDWTWDSRWATQTIAVLPGAPTIAVFLDHKFIVATSRSLIYIHPNGSVETILSDCFWWATTPNSIVKDDEGNIYIGMKQGVIKWKPGKNKDTMQWLLPSEKFLNDALDRLNGKKKMSQIE